MGGYRVARDHTCTIVQNAQTNDEAKAEMLRLAHDETLRAIEMFKGVGRR